MKIRFRRKSQSEWFVLFVLVMPFAFFLLMDILRFPSAIKYTVDVAWLLLLVSIIKNRHLLCDKQTKRMALVAVLFFASTIWGQIGNFQSLLYYLWGLRNNARFFVFFFACIFYINAKSVEHYFRFFEVLLYINVPVVLYQYFVLGKNRDHLGGIFGVEQGCNAFMNIFLLIVVTYSVLRYMNYMQKASKCFTNCVIALVIALLSELKVFIIEFAIIILLASVMTRFSLRKLWVILAAVIGIIASAQAIVVLFPVFSGWFSIEKIWDSISSKSGYTSSNDMNRFTAIPIILERFLSSTWTRIFGLGLGNCDYAAYDFLTTPFYTSYKKLHYVWFSSAYLMLETGALGSILYLLFFCMIYIGVDKKQKSCQAPLLYCQMAKILTVMCFILIIYNSSMRIESAYMMYFALSIPFIKYAN